MITVMIKSLSNNFIQTKNIALVSTFMTQFIKEYSVVVVKKKERKYLSLHKIPI